jgi:hypothetical protein
MDLEIVDWLTPAFFASSAWLSPLFSMKVFISTRTSCMILNHSEYYCITSEIVVRRRPDWHSRYTSVGVESERKQVRIFDIF